MLSNDRNYFFFRQQEGYKGPKLSKRSIAKQFQIPVTTFFDLSVKKREADGYPKIGRTNFHAKLLTFGEEKVSFLNVFIG